MADLAEYERLRDAYAEAYGVAQANEDKTDYRPARAALDAFVLAALEDSKRLDWLEQHLDRVSGPASDNNPRWVVWGDEEGQDIEAPTLRAAIDAARAAEEKP